MIRVMTALPVLALGSLILAAAHAEGAPAPTAADAFLAGVRRTVLPNGLTVLVHQQPGSGVVAINTWVKAGYYNEPDEVAGMAHLFEHMFFKGSKAFPGAEQIGQAVSAVGGVSNAGTIYDSTNYYFVLPKEGFARGVQIQADAIRNPLFDQAELKKEAEVVIEESNRKLDNPPAVALERMYATAFTQHRMKRWRIGSNEVLRNIKRENLLAFFETLYRPENIIVTVAGDVTPEEALAAVSKEFGAIPKGTLDKKRGPVEPAQTAFRFGQSAADLQQGYSVFGWHTVAINDPQEVTLDVLARILGQGRSSRLYRAAIGGDAASTVQASHETFEDVGVFEILSSFDEANRAEVGRRIVREVERLKAYGPTEYELALARNGAEVDALSSLEDALDQAQQLSQAESRGSYRDIASRLQRLQALRAEDVRDAARRFLTVENLTLYHYQPKGAAAVTADAALAAVRAAALGELPRPESVPVPRIASGVRPASSDRPIQEMTLSNGATLVVRERHGAPLVSTGVYFRGGRSAESAANNGITRLMASAMSRGTASRTGDEIDRQIEFLGTGIQAEVLDDYVGWSVDSVTRFYEPSLDILTDVVLHPTFPADGVEKEKHLRLGAIKRSMDQGLDRAQQLFRKALFGDHPYGLNAQGDAAVIEALGPAALRDWWGRTVTASGATVIVVGDVAAEDVRRVIEAKLASLQKGASAAEAPPAPPVPASPRELIESRDRKQTSMIVAFPTVPPSHPDWAALRLLQSLTSGLSGTFFAELRGKRSLAYTVFAQAEALERRGSFFAYLACEAGKEPEARAGLLGEMRRLQSDGVRADDLERAKSYFAGSQRIARQANHAQLGELARGRYLGVGYDFVDRMLARTKDLTVQDLQAVAARYLAGDDYVYAAVRGTTVKPVTPGPS